MKLPRRQFLHLAAGAAALPLLSVPVSVPAQLAPSPDQTPQPTQTERDAMSNLANAFMQQYDVPGFSVAVGRAGALVYTDAFGWTDREKREAASPTNLFRIASVT